MTHEELQHSIPAYLSRRLPEAERRRLEAHLSDCEECGDLVASLRRIPEAIARHGNSLFDPHPASPDLRRFARGEPIEDRERVDKHLAVCVSCELEVAGWSAPGPPVGDPAIRGAGGRASAAARLAAGGALVAAGLVLGVLLAPLAPGRGRSVDGPIDLPVLARPTRSGAAATLIHVRAGQRAVVVAVPFDPVEGGASAERLQLRVVASSGQAVYTLSDTVAGLKGRADSSGIIPLMIDTLRLPPGAYQVEVAPEGIAGEPIKVMPFEVVTEGPAAGRD